MGRWFGKGWLEVENSVENQGHQDSGIHEHQDTLNTLDLDLYQVAEDRWSRSGVTTTLERVPNSTSILAGAVSPSECFWRVPQRRSPT